MRGFDPRKTGYKQVNSMDRKMFEELLPGFDKKIYIDTIQGCKSAISDAEIFGLATASSNENHSQILTRWAIEGSYGEAGYFTMKFIAPIIQLVNKEFSSLHNVQYYAKPGIVEYMPAYMMNLNHIALTKFQPTDGPRYERIIKNTYSRFSFKKGRTISLSSDNILLHGSVEPSIQSIGTDLVDRCLEYCYWRHPPSAERYETSCMNNLIYHSNSRITHIYRLYKTMIRILKIGRQETVNVNNRRLNCTTTDVALLVDNGNGLVSQKSRILIASRLMTGLGEDSLLNAVLVSDAKRPQLLIAIGKIGMPKLGDVSHILSIALHERLQSTTIDSDLTCTGTLDETHKCLSTLIEENSGEDDLLYPRAMWDPTIKQISGLVDDLFPLYLRKADTVYHVPPALLAAMMTSFTKIPPKSTILSISMLLGNVVPDAESWESASLGVLNTDSFPRLSSTSGIESLLRQLPVVASQTVYSRILARRP